MKPKTIMIISVIIISFFAQYLVFALLDRQTGKLLNPSIVIDRAYLVKADITDAQNLQLSYNNKYLSFTKENRLEVIDLNQNKPIFDSTIFFDPFKRILSYRWLPDRNSLLVLIDEPNQFEVHLYSLDFNNQTNAEYSPHLDRVFSFPMTEIISIEISTYTNNLFILFEDTRQNRKLIKMDIMMGINWLDLPQETIHNIAASNRFGNLFIESSIDLSRQIMSLEGQERKVISDHPEDILLGCIDNTVYVGRISDGYLHEIYSYDYYGKDKTVINSWIAKLPYNEDYTFLSSDKKIMIKENERLTIFLEDGTFIETLLPEDPVVFSPTGNIYLQIEWLEKGFNYYWRTIHKT